jgi:gamma-glutamylcyclotransferase (GGCT)/AIG2-like uncharacterized protein YtfP
MKQDIFTLFVYGSLRSGFHHQAYEYMTRYFNLTGPAKVRGVLYDLGEYPAALPSNSDHWILGELYQLKDPSEFWWAIEQLDDYEGLNVEEGEVALYRREVVDVFLDKQTVKAWIYWYNKDISDKPRIESGDVLDYLRQKNKS